ncbi:hypothetical protein B0J14DRAFT_586481 [Halenospora varia]|nr:hypothetical protein B0J14DRAFT_586481 [Halenospora varia]
MTLALVTTIILCLPRPSRGAMDTEKQAGEQELGGRRYDGKPIAVLKIEEEGVDEKEVPPPKPSKEATPQYRSTSTSTPSPLPPALLNLLTQKQTSPPNSPQQPP